MSDQFPYNSRHSDRGLRVRLAAGLRRDRQPGAPLPECALARRHLLPRDSQDDCRQNGRPVQTVQHNTRDYEVIVLLLDFLVSVRMTAQSGRSMLEYHQHLLFAAIHFLC